MALPDAGQFTHISGHKLYFKKRFTVIIIQRIKRFIDVQSTKKKCTEHNTLTAIGLSTFMMVKM